MSRDKLSTLPLMLTDPIEYAARRAGPRITALRLTAVADDLAAMLRECGEELIRAPRDSRNRFWHHVSGKPSRRISPAEAGRMLLVRFRESTKLVLSGDAEHVKTWRQVAEMVAEGFHQSTSEQSVESWVLSHVVHSTGDWMRRDQLLTLVVSAVPGPEVVRGRELADALLEHGLTSSYETKRRIDGRRYRTWENIKFVP